MEQSDLKNNIHPTAILEGEITIGEGNVIGPHVVIQGKVTIGNNNIFKTGVVIENNVTLGSNNTIYPYASIGAYGEMGSKGDRFVEEGIVLIGDEVTIREFVCIHSPVHALETRIQDKVYLMNKSYVAHDCQVGKGSVLSAGVLLAGRVEIGDYVNLGLGVTVHQRMHVGAHAMVGMQAVITSDILPYATVAGNPARILRFNRKGVEHLGYGEQWMLEVEKFFNHPNLELGNLDNPMLKEIHAFLHLHPDSLFLVKQ